MTYMALAVAIGLGALMGAARAARAGGGTSEEAVRAGFENLYLFVFNLLADGSITGAFKPLPFCKVPEN